MLRLEWTEKNENRLIVVGTLVAAVLLTIFGVMVARYNAQHTEAPAPSVSPS